MTDLTEQWEKGELPNGYYWIRLSWGGMIIMAYYTGFDGLFELDDYYYDSDKISEVLALVPSYDEWQAKLEENAQLKELLKDLRDEADGALQAIQKDCESDDFSIFQYPEVQYFYDLLTKIDEVLK